MVSTRTLHVWGQGEQAKLLRADIETLIESLCRVPLCRGPVRHLANTHTRAYTTKLTGCRAVPCYHRMCYAAMLCHASFSTYAFLCCPLLQNLLNRLLTVDLPGLMVLPQRLEISIPPSVTSIAEAAVGRDTIMRAVASAVLQVCVIYVGQLLAILSTPHFNCFLGVDMWCGTPSTELWPVKCGFVFNTSYISTYIVCGWNGMLCVTSRVFVHACDCSQLMWGGRGQGVVSTAASVKVVHCAGGNSFKELCRKDACLC
jgi:hypothetical protein